MPLLVLVAVLGVATFGFYRQTQSPDGPPAVVNGTGAPNVVPPGTPAPTPTPTTVEVPQRFGRYTEAVVGGVPTVINPLLPDQSDPNLTGLIFSGLTKLDETGKVYGDLADQIDLDPTGMVYTFHIRNGTRWHDGQPVTPQDVLFTVRLIQDANYPGDPELANLWRTVTVDLPGDGKDGRVRFTLKDRYAPFLGLTTIGILPQHILGGIKAEDLADQPFNLAPIGTGPYKLVGIEPGGPAVNLVLNPQHYEVATEAAYFIQELRFQYYATFDLALNAAKASATTGVMGIGEVPVGDLQRANATLNTSAKNVDWKFYGYNIAAYDVLLFNNQSPIFSDRAVRQAADQAIDRQALVNSIPGQQALPGDGPILPNSWAYKPEAAKHPFDPAAAKQLLDDAGWKVKSGAQVREKGGQKLAFTLITNGSGVRPQIAQAVATQLAAVGFDVQVNRMPLSAFDVEQTYLVPRNYDAVLFGFSGLLPDPDAYPFWHSSGAGSGYNFTDFRDTDSDVALENGRRATNPTERRQWYAQFQDRFIAEAPAAVLYYPRYVTVMRTDMRGVQSDTINVAADRFRGISRWYLKYSTVSPAQATANAPPTALPPTAAPTYAATNTAVARITGTPGSAPPASPPVGSPAPARSPAPNPINMPSNVPAPSAATAKP